MRQLTLSVAACLVALALASCAAAAPAPTTLADAKALEDRVRELMIECLQDKGWDVVAETDGWSIEGLPQSQADAYEADYAACMVETGADQIQSVPMTDERLREWYDHEMFLVDCLTVAGHSVPPIPSFQTFEELYESGSPWSAYSFLGEAVGDQETWLSLQEACPQYGA